MVGAVAPCTRRQASTLISWLTARQALSFGAIGFLAFLSDAVLLTLAQWLLGLGLVPARLCVFAVTVTMTWWLNRRLTFGSSAEAPTEWLRYATVNGIGSLLNLGIFFWLVFRFSALSDAPILALAIAASITMTYSFLASKYIAFRNVHR